MKDRCYNPNVEGYKYYGGRGISICQEWIEDFEAFYQYMGPKPSPDHSIDRWPNGDGNYEPGNVRWATNTQQSQNRRPCGPAISEGKKRYHEKVIEEFGPHVWITDGISNKRKYKGEPIPYGWKHGLTKNK
jgi:hypothetical protein